MSPAPRSTQRHGGADYAQPVNGGDPFVSVSTTKGVAATILVVDVRAER